jgi:hypothetical protein
MIDADDLDTPDAGKSKPRLVDRASHLATLFYAIGLGTLGVAIIVIGIVAAFQH